MGTTKKNATKPNKRFRGGGKSRMASRLFRSKLKMKTMAPLAPKHVIPRMVMSRLAKGIMSHLPGATLDDPNKLSLVAVEALHTAAEEFLADVLSCSYALARHANRTELMDSDIKCICMVMRTLNKTTFGDDGFHAKLKGVLADTETQASSATDGTDSGGTDSADNRVVEEPEPTDDEDNVTNDGATEDATAGDTIADEPTEVGTFAAHHTNNEHHQDATVATDSADNRAVEEPEPSQNGNNSVASQAPGNTSTENGTIYGLTEAHTSSASHARDVSRIPQPPVGRTAAEENRTRIMRYRERQKYMRYVEDCRRRGVEPRM